MANHNKIGVSTAFLRFFDFENFIQEVKKLDVDYVEFKADPPCFFPLNLTDEGIEFIKRKLSSCDIKPIVHTTIYDVNLSSLNPTIREASVKTTLDCLELAKKLGAEILVVHGGNLPSNYSLRLMEKANENLLLSLGELVKVAEKKGVIIGLENNAKGFNTGLVKKQDEHLFFLEKINSRFLKAVFDIGHANLYGLSIEDYTRKIKDFLVEIHLHNNQGEKDNHFPLDQGKIDIENFLELIDELDISVPLILEMTSLEDYEKSVNFLKDRNLLTVYGAP
ncbi:MAG: sugar phosphate isomerase/epimerase family protein [Candidatus Zixiibacteriota bacterium]